LLQSSRTSHVAPESNRLVRYAYSLDNSTAERVVSLRASRVCASARARHFFPSLARCRLAHTSATLAPSLLGLTLAALASLSLPAACAASVSARVVGGVTPVDVGDPMALAAARAAVAAADDERGSPARHVLRAILPSSTKQVIAGIAYVFDVVADSTTCAPRAQSAAVPDEDCPVVPLAAVTVHAKVWAQPWRLQEPYRVTAIAVEPLDEVRAAA